MDKQLQNLIRVMEVQDNVNALRTEVPSVYNKLLRKEASCEIKKLLSANINIGQAPLTIPNLDNAHINHIKLKPSLSFSELQHQSQDIRKCIQYMKKSS